MTAPDTAAPGAPVVAKSEAWAAPPLIAGDWRDLTMAESVPLLLRYAQKAESERLRRLFVEHWPVRVRAMRPRCYPGWILAEVEAVLPDGEAGLLAFLYGPGGITTIDGSSNPIHDLNGTGALAIKEPALALDYLRFFCSAIHGEEGRFQIVESPFDLLPIADAEARAAVLAASKSLRQASVHGGDGTYLGHGSVLYGGSLFHATFSVQPTGNITMVDDEPGPRPRVRREPFRPPFRIVDDEGYDA